MIRAYFRACERRMERAGRQYQVNEDKRSGITSDPNNPDDEEYIVRLVGRVITVSMETVRLVEELSSQVRQEEWLGESSEATGEPAAVIAVE